VCRGSLISLTIDKKISARGAAHPKAKTNQLRVFYWATQIPAVEFCVKEKIENSSTSTLEAPSMDPVEELPVVPPMLPLGEGDPFTVAPVVRGTARAFPPPFFFPYSVLRELTHLSPPSQ
jgi:hypothetical protein